MTNLSKAFAIALSMTVGIASVGLAQTTGKSRVVLTLDKGEFFLGENVLVHYCFENTSDQPITVSVGSDYRGASRSLRFKVTVTDDAGTAMPDPDPSGYSLGGIGGSPQIEKGARWCQSLPLMRYARIDRPGNYEVRVVHDLGLPAGEAPEGRVMLRLTMPTDAQAEEVIVAMAALPPNPGTVMGRLSKPYADFSALRYGVYLPPLFRRARTGDAVSSTAIGAIPTPEATRALVGLLGESNAAVSRAAARALSARLPDPALDGALGPRNVFDNELKDARRYLINASWRPEFAMDVRSAAMKFLEASDTEDVRLGAFMLQAVGVPGDGALLSVALTRAIENTRTLPFETGVYPRPRGSVMELLRTADILVGRGYAPLTPGDTPGGLALWLVALGHGARPGGWQDDVARALIHPIPFVRELAMERLQAEVPDVFIPAIGENLKSSDPDVQIAACNLVARSRISVLHTQVSEARTAKEWTLRECGNTLWALGARFERVEILVSRLTEPAMAATVLEHLLGLLDNDGWSGCCAVPGDQAQALSVRWRALVTSHRADIEAGREIPLEAQDVTPDLLPPGMALHRRGKPNWPSDRTQ